MCTEGSVLNLASHFQSQILVWELRDVPNQLLTNFTVNSGEEILLSGQQSLPDRMDQIGKKSLIHLHLQGLQPTKKANK